MTLQQALEIIEAQRPVDTGLAYRFLQNWEDASDAYGDARLTFARYAEGWLEKEPRSEEHVRNYFRKILVQSCGYLAKKRSGRQVAQVSLDNVPELSSGKDEPPSAPAEAGSFLAAVQDCCESLPETQRTTFKLREFEEKSYDEIADLVKIGADAVKQLAFRARLSVRKCLIKKGFNYETAIA